MDVQTREAQPRMRSQIHIPKPELQLGCAPRTSAPPSLALDLVLSLSDNNLGAKLSE